MFSSVRTGLSEELKELDSKGLYKRAYRCNGGER